MGLWREVADLHKMKWFSEWDGRKGGGRRPERGLCKERASLDLDFPVS